ncbi:caspase family protein [Lujinxingia vulgaris]|uniref:Caspase family protein n=1 Tax=Lujinxingia vulgaris TaxID=2600176 RepID=A0A5C6XM90_9DELT|nr:caspase family protein [Lujinxingia vulgaris]TXD38464.1 caspase family protein [Lujinxingia vulgaris]
MASLRSRHPFSLLAALAAALLFQTPTLASAQAPPPGPYPALSAPAQVERSGARDAAIIVALQDYVFLPDVPGAIDNANDWERFLSDDLGVPRVHTLTDRQATREQLLRFAEQAASEVGEGGTLWFVFIGHGAPGSATDGLLVGVDAQQDPDSLKARGLAQQALLDVLNNGKQANTVMVVDACFSGRASNGDPLAPTQPVIPINVQPTLSKSTVILSAAEATEFAGALPGAERPAFSYLLLGALRGWASSEEQVSARDAWSFTRRALRGIPGRFQQTPSIFGNDELVLVRGASESNPGIEQIMRTAASSPSTPHSDPTPAQANPAENSARYQSFALSPGFVPDPAIGRGLAGGAVNAASLGPVAGGECIGMVDARPDHTVKLSTDFGYLRFGITSAADTSLAIRRPDGSFLCDDDTHGLNPEIAGRMPAGDYQIFIGAIGQADDRTYRLELSERPVNAAPPQNPGSSAAQANFPGLTLSPGFTPDPSSASGLAGGTIDASSITGATAGCAGKISNRPDHILTLGGHFSTLYLGVNSQADTSLIIRRPDGSFVCNDDTHGLNPRISGTFGPGTYQIYVGSLASGNPSYDLYASELSYGVPSPGAAPTPTPGGSYQRFSLSPGFSPDPAVGSGTAGGSRDASSLGGSPTGPCAGNIDTSPDHRVTLQSSFSYLKFSASSPIDTSLVILGPGGSRYCNDDSDGLDPAIEGAFPAGEYEVYIGKVGTSDSASYTLEITELR